MAGLYCPLMIQTLGNTFGKPTTLSSTDYRLPADHAYRRDEFTTPKRKKLSIDGKSDVLSRIDA